MKIEIPEVKVTNYQLWTCSKIGGCWYPVWTGRSRKRRNPAPSEARTIYVVDGVEYLGGKAICAALNINAGNLLYRCNSPMPKWKGWTRKE